MTIQAPQLGWGALLLACSQAFAAGDAPACDAPDGAALVAAHPQWARKFGLALQSCEGLPVARPPSPAALQAQALVLYDEAAKQPLAPAAAPAPVATPRSAPQRALAFAPAVAQVSHDYDIDPLLLHAIAHVESRHNPAAVSPAGAIGLMQVMPATARRFGVGDPAHELLDPRTSLEVGSAYLKTLQARFGNRLELVLAAYNAGEGAVERHGRSVPPYAQTRDYVREVMSAYRALKGL